MNIKLSSHSNVLAVVWNYALAYVVYMVVRVAYVLENWSLFADGWDALNLGEVLAGSLRFDSSAICYTNALWAVLMLLPLHFKERRWWHAMLKWVYVVVNSLGMAVNLVDAVYSQFTGRRTTWSFFAEFSNEGNLGSIVWIELGRHWYLVLLGVALVALMWWLYMKPEPVKGRPVARPLWTYYVAQTLGLAVAVPLSVIAMRGGATTAVRPITISNANQYVNTPTEAAIVLNTPFSLIRTAGKTPFADPHYMLQAEADSLYSALHLPAGTGEMRKKNVVVLIVESFGREYIGFYNDYQGFTPFVDSLLAQSLTFTHTFANGRKSIDGMPSILSSIPMFVEPFFLTTSSLNDVSGLAGLLGHEGYETAFFHGAENGSMGFQAFARTTGFERYFGRTEYDADTAFGGERDFDGTWAIWDEPFLQFYARQMSLMREPFATAVFTASSHHPFVVPDEYEGRFPEGTLPIHRCIGYTDHALREFFRTASLQPWYGNTIFVLTSDHTNASDRSEYLTSVGTFSAPILIFDPSGDLPRGVVDGVAQQIDILPTVLHALGYDKPYVAFGKDLLDAEPGRWAVNYSGGIYQLIEGDYVLLFDGTAPKALYDYVADPLLKDNLAEREPERVADMTRRLKAIIQVYMVRMTTNNLVFKPSQP